MLENVRRICCLLCVPALFDKHKLLQPCKAQHRWIVEALNEAGEALPGLSSWTVHVATLRKLSGRQLRCQAFLFEQVAVQLAQLCKDKNS